MMGLVGALKEKGCLRGKKRYYNENISLGLTLERVNILYRRSYRMGERCEYYYSYKIYNNLRLRDNCPLAEWDHNNLLLE